MKVLQVLFGLFIMAVLISQSAMDLFSTLLCLWWIYLFVSKNEKVRNLPFLPKTGAEYAFLAWFTVVILGFLFHWDDTAYAFSRIIEFKWILVLWVIVGVFLALKPSEESKKFLFYFGLLVAGVNLILYFTAIPQFAPWRYGAYGDYVRAGGFFANHMTFAHSYVIFSSFLLGLFVFNWKQFAKRWRVLAGLVVALSFLGLLLTFTRGVWIGFSVGMAVGLLLWKPRLLAALGILAAISLPLVYQNSTLFRMRIKQTQSEVTGYSERKLIWQAHWKVFSEQPILGAGYGQNTKKLPEIYAEMGVPPDTLVSHAHNQYLHLAAGTGILGLLCYLGIWFVFLSKSFGLWFKAKLDSWDRGVVWGLIVGQVAFLVGGLTESNFEHSKVRFMVMLAWAYVIYLSDKYKKRPA